MDYIEVISEIFKRVICHNVDDVVLLYTNFIVVLSWFSLAADTHGRSALFRFAAVFLWDSGSSVGDLAAHSKIINSVDIRQKRPYRLITGSDDNCASFFEGPPFKFKFTATVSFRCLQS